MLNVPNSQPLSEKELKSKFAKNDLFSFRGYLARKGQPKSYTEKKKPTYRLNILGFFGGSILRILAAFMAVSAFLTGIFFGSDIAGIGAALVILVALEYLQIRNATELFETWFMENRINVSNIVYGLLFSSCTAMLAFSGVDETIRFVSETVSPFSFDESKVNPTLLADIKKADADAAEFYEARTWRKKLDIKDAKQYNALKTHAADLRKQYREELSTARMNEKTAYEMKVAGTKKNEADNRALLMLLIGITEILFWLAFFHKERYEYFALMEYQLTGEIEQGPEQKTNTKPSPSSNGQAKQFTTLENFQ